MYRNLLLLSRTVIDKFNILKQRMIKVRFIVKDWDMWWYWPSSWNRCRYWWSLRWSPATCTGHREFTFWFSFGPPRVWTLKKPTFISPSGNWTIPPRPSALHCLNFAEINFRLFAKITCKIYRNDENFQEDVNVWTIFAKTKCREIFSKSTNSHFRQMEKMYFCSNPILV
jgi:hypothetical protein